MTSGKTPAEGPVIVVVGGGFSGLLTTVHLLRKLPAARVHLVERADAFGEGAAYSTLNPDHVLNVRLANMSAFPDAPSHLSEWLSRQPRWSSRDGFITRGDYGRYLKDILAEAVETDGGRLSLVHDDAVAIDRDGDGWTVGLANGEALRAAHVVLALGNLAPAEPAGLDEAVVRAGRYIADPWRAAAELPETARRVLLIGSGLSMIDVALSLAHPKRRIAAVSRRGLAPRAHRAAAPAVGDLTFTGSPLEVLGQARALARTTDWRTVADSLRHSGRSLWRGWTPKQHRQFMRHLRPFWEVHRHRLAPSVANRMHALIASGGLSIEAGRIVRISLESDRVVVGWRPRGGPRVTTRKVDAVINCTGPLADLASSDAPLIRSLIEGGHGVGDRDGLGFRVDDRARLIDGEGTAQETLYAVGPLTRGAFWEITSVPDIRIQAAEVAEAIRVGAGVGRRS